MRLRDTRLYCSFGSDPHVKQEISLLLHKGPLCVANRPLELTAALQFRVSGWATLVHDLNFKEVPNPCGTDVACKMYVEMLRRITTRAGCRVLDQHSCCATFEHPVCLQYDARYLGSRLDGAVKTLQHKGYLNSDTSQAGYQLMLSEAGYKLKTIAHSNSCTVTTTWFGFSRTWQGSNQIFDTVVLSLPNFSYAFHAFWIRIPQPVKEKVEHQVQSFRAGQHVASHALLNVIPLYITCITSDRGSACENSPTTRFVPERLLLYDSHPAGIALSALVQVIFGDLLPAALELVTTCNCSTYCVCYQRTMPTATKSIELVKLFIQNLAAKFKSGRLYEPYKVRDDYLASKLKDEAFVSLWKGNTPYVIHFFPNQALIFTFKDYFLKLFNFKPDREGY
ncbi:uncharacterized protein [Aristolochia californica]|uniref:uncharacterized protein n=1 Tax=Aristolochia californica TaxID=171875 RepID=UPI0035E01A1D